MMRSGKKVGVIVLAVLVTLASGGALFHARADNCNTAFFAGLGLMDEEGNPITNLVAAPVAAGSPLPAYCNVTGTLYPMINFHVVLPTTTWNGKFYMAGGGGFNGSIPVLTAGLSLNYATAGTDSGHTGTALDASFAYNPPDNSNPNAALEKIDFCYLSYKETALVAKKMIRAFYGSDPRHSYWVGCSEGGREALMMAQRFPDLFAGIVAGSPVRYLTRTHMWSIWNPIALLGNGSIALNQLPTLAKAVYNKCDSVDGLIDGFIDDPRKCPVDPAKDLPLCSGSVPGPTCFTLGQVAALKKIWGGVVTSWGEKLFPGVAIGTEALTNPADTSGATSGWVPWLVPSPSLQQLIGTSSMQYFTLTPPPGPTWVFTDYNFDTDPPKMLETSKLVDELNPDLWRFKQRGGKMIHYVGWGDPAVGPYQTTDYYENVLKTMVGVTDEFYKLYMVPGMGHCGGGIGCSTVDWFTPLVNWVEKGIQPEAITGTRTATPYLGARTRPLCPYPEVARYLGTGSIDVASNFSCVKTLPAFVKIEPTLSLASPTFTAYITLPETCPVHA